jgi:hypothetical protein
MAEPKDNNDRLSQNLKIDIGGRPVMGGRLFPNTDPRSGNRGAAINGCNLGFALNFEVLSGWITNSHSSFATPLPITQMILHRDRSVAAPRHLDWTITNQLNGRNLAACYNRKGGGSSGLSKPSP